MPETSGASEREKASARCIASRLAVSSPITMEKYEIAMVTTTSTNGEATFAGTPQASTDGVM